MADKATIKKEAERLRYRGRIWYLYQGAVYDSNLDIFIQDAANGFLDLYECFEYFPQPII